MADEVAKKGTQKAEKEAVKAPDRTPRGDDAAPEVPLADGPPVKVRGPSVERTVSPSPFGELNTLDPRNSRDPLVRELAAAQVNTEVARAQVEASDVEVTVTLTAAEAAALLGAAWSPGHDASSAVDKLEAALNAEVEKQLSKKK